MRFSELLKSAGAVVRRLRGEAEVTQVAIDSRQVRQGTCFIAVRGASDDGHRYIPAAVAAGCAAVVCEDLSQVPEGVPAAQVPDARALAGRLAQAVLGWPVRKLSCVAVTGTNGKSTTVCLIRDVLQAVGFRPALLGTITYETGQRVLPASHTTPDPVCLAELTAEMVADGRTHLIMETSSHAIDQDRTSGLDYRVAVFTNLTGDHLDYHGTMDQYLAAKRKLFEQLSPDAAAVVNIDDPAGEKIASATKGVVRTYGLSPLAGVRGRIEEINLAGTRFSILTEGSAVDVHLPLIGRHNVYNALAAAAACEALRVPLADVAKALAGVSAVPGRLQRVNAAGPIQVFVDYAHTDDALHNVLGALRPLTPGKVILLFGCGGDRDRTKRPRMAQMAERQADWIVVTSDNPRSEDPQAIIDEILRGFSPQGLQRVEVHTDRREAIDLAVRRAGPGDVVLIAGKGHEKYQIIGARRLAFDDVAEAQAALSHRQEAAR